MCVYKQVNSHTPGGIHSKRVLHCNNQILLLALRLTGSVFSLYFGRMAIGTLDIRSIDRNIYFT